MFLCKQRSCIFLKTTFLLTLSALQFSSHNSFLTHSSKCRSNATNGWQRRGSWWIYAKRATWRTTWKSCQRAQRTTQSWRLAVSKPVCILDQVFYLQTGIDANGFLFNRHISVSRGCGNQNFAWRTECNQCKAPKPEGFIPPPFPPQGKCGVFFLLLESHFKVNLNAHF